MSVHELEPGIVMPNEEAMVSADMYYAQVISLVVMGEGSEREDPFAVFFFDDQRPIAIGNNPASLRLMAKNIGLAADEIEKIQEGMGSGVGKEGS